MKAREREINTTCVLICTVRTHIVLHCMFQLVKQRAKTRLPAGVTAQTSIPVVVCTVVVPKTASSYSTASPFLLFWLQFANGGAGTELALPELPVALLQSAPDRAMAKLKAVVAGAAAAAFDLEPRGFVGVPEAGQGGCVYWVEARLAASARAAALWQWMPPYCGSGGVWALASEILNNTAVGPWGIRSSVVQMFQSLPQLALLEMSKCSSSNNNTCGKWYSLPDAMYATTASVRELERCFVLGIQMEPEKLTCVFPVDGEKEDVEETHSWGRFAVWESPTSAAAAQICLGIGTNKQENMCV